MTQKCKQFAVDEEIDTATIVYNEGAALIEAAYKNIQVLINLHEPCTERDAKNEVSEDTLETLNESENEVSEDTLETR